MYMGNHDSHNCLYFMLGATMTALGCMSYCMCKNNGHGKAMLKMMGQRYQGYKCHHGHQGHGQHQEYQGYHMQSQQSNNNSQNPENKQQKEKQVNHQEK